MDTKLPCLFLSWQNKVRKSPQREGPVLFFTAWLVAGLISVLLATTRPTKFPTHFFFLLNTKNSRLKIILRSWLNGPGEVFLSAKDAKRPNLSRIMAGLALQYKNDNRTDRKCIK